MVRFNLLIVLSLLNACVSKPLSPLCSFLHLSHPRVTALSLHQNRSRAEETVLVQVRAGRRRGLRTPERGSCPVLEKGTVWSRDAGPAWVLTARNHWARGSEPYCSREHGAHRYACSLWPQPLGSPPAWRRLVSGQGDLPFSPSVPAPASSGCCEHQSQRRIGTWRSMNTSPHALVSPSCRDLTFILSAKGLFCFCSPTIPAHHQRAHCPSSPPPSEAELAIFGDRNSPRSPRSLLPEGHQSA